MQDTRYKWRTLPNPFFYNDTNATSGIIGRVSGRSKDIVNIIYNDQSAIILSGAPRIGKTALLRYLQTALQTQSYSWRQEQELVRLIDRKILDATHFVQIDLVPLESVYQSATQKEVYPRFLQQCGEALYQVHQVNDQLAPTDLKGLRTFLRHMEQNQPEMRCFVILDNIDRLGMDTTSFLLGNINAKTPQERGIALLHDCGAIRLLTGLIEEFRNFGVILSLESLPRARVEAQFTHISADLAHFATTTLQIFTCDDTRAFLRQEPAAFGNEWSQLFIEQAGEIIFSQAEQVWIYEQAGSHPYILQQFCLHTFSFKQLRAEQHNRWLDLEEETRHTLVEYVKGQIITFLNRMWKRLQVALAMVSPDTQGAFFKFIASLSEMHPGDAITAKLWNELGTEIQYVLYNEGIVRYDPFQTVYAPGALLSNYLLQKVTEADSIRTRSPRLVIKFPEATSEPMILSELEYKLVKKLQQHPKRCAEDELMRAGWNRMIEGKTFTQRMYQLRKKLKGKSETDVIMNHYGGFYSLVHPEWLQFLE
jgi:hypothetical protein